MKVWNASSATALVSAIQISCNARLAFGCRLLGSLASTFAVMCTQQRCLRLRPDRGGFPEPERTIGDDEPRRHFGPAPLQVEQQIAPALRALAGHR